MKLNKNILSLHSSLQVLATWAADRENITSATLLLQYR